MLFLPRMDVNRKGLAVEKFARLVTPDAVPELLSPVGKGHTWLEFFHDDTVTKFYYDTERYFDVKPPPEVEAGYLSEVRNAMDTIVNVLQVASPHHKVTYVIAQRHGFDVGHAKKGKPAAASAAEVASTTSPDEVASAASASAAAAAAAPRYKLSFRTFVSGVAVVYHRIPHIMKNVEDLKKTLHLWDASVYKRGEQLLGAVGGHKKHTDRRVLAPLGGRPEDFCGDGGSLLRYVAGYVDPTWQVANVPDDDDEGVGGPSEPPRPFAYEGGDAADPRVLALVDMLGVATAADRSEWIRVAIVLRHLGGGGDVYLEAWLAFSRLAKDDGAYVDDRDCVKTWKGLGGAMSGVSAAAASPSAPSRRELTLGTLCYFAKRDDPEGYRRWRREEPRFELATPTVDALPFDAPETPGPPTAGTALRRTRSAVVAARPPFEVAEGVTLNEQAIVAALKATIPDLADSDVVLEVASDGIHFSGGHVRGLVRVRDCFVELEDGRKPGHLFHDFDINENISFIHKDIPRNSRFGCTLLSELDATLTGKPPHADTTVMLHNITTPAMYVVAKVPDKQSVQVNRSASDKLVGVINRSIASRAASEFGITNNLFINNGIINVVLNPEVKRHTDIDLVNALIATDPDVLRTHRFAPDAKLGACFSMYVCHPKTCIWEREHCADVEQTFIDKLMSIEALTKADRTYIQSHRGRNDVLYAFYSKVSDKRFASKLDSNLDFFAVDNGVFDMRDMRFRPIVPEDLISTTSGWSYDPELAKTHRAELEEYLAMMLPLPEERRVFLTYFALLLSGRRTAKKFMVLTDRCGGNNGKSTLLTLMRMFFGEFTYSAGVKFLCMGSFVRDRDSHDAGLNGLCNKRLMVADEMKHTMQFDEATIKQLTGGDDLVVQGRRCGTPIQFKYVWQAGIVIAFNEYECPRFDPGDVSFINRMMIMPMRAKFVVKAKVGSRMHGGDGVIHALSDTIKSRFPPMMSALSDILVDHFIAEDCTAFFEDLPESMVTWRQGIAAATHPLGDWIDEVTEVTGKPSDYVLASELKQIYPARAAGSNAPYTPFSSQLARSFFAEQHPEVVHKSPTKVNPRNGGPRVSKNDVFRGVRFRVSPPSVHPVPTP
jgi:phage/plasmid-associated DNA primase